MSSPNKESPNPATDRDDREIPTASASDKLDELTHSEPRVIPDEIRVFISFANSDKEAVERLKETLEATWGEKRTHRVKFWTFHTPEGGGILAGEDNLDEIRKSIASCPLALFLLSPSFMQSEFIKENELLPYFPRTPGNTDKHPVFVNLRNSKPPASHLSDEICARNIFSHEEKSFDQMHRQGAREKFAAALNDHLELLCQKHFPGTPGDAEPPALVPEQKDDDFSPIPSKYQRNELGVNAVDDLLAWARDVERGHYFALLGETGSGKTTTLLMFARALNAAKGPVRAYLFDLRYANYDGLLQRTANRPTLLQLMDAILNRGGGSGIPAGDYLKAAREERAVLIFDGLDEIFVALDSGQQDTLMRELLSALPLATARRENAGKLLFACRTQYFRSPQGERGGLTLQGREGLDLGDGAARRTAFELARILPFSEPQIRAYFEANLPAIPFADIWRTLEQIHALTDLATRPYLLNLIRRQLPALNARVEKNEPVRAIDLYRGFVEDWGHERNKFHNVLLPEDKHDLMVDLAVHLWRLGAKSLPAADLERWLLDRLVAHPRWRVIYADQLKPRAQDSLLGDFRTASFVARWDGDTFRFAHTSLQEYFLACHLARALERGETDAWDLPMPSVETLDFLGQTLQSLPGRGKELALGNLRALLADPDAPADARRNAFRYHLLACKKELPTVECPDLALAGLDLDDWKIKGTEARPLLFGAVDFSSTCLFRATFEHVRFTHASQWEGADLRAASVVGCDLNGADFSAVQIDGLFFRRCDLRDTRAEARGTSKARVHLCKTNLGGPWPELPPPVRPTLRFLLGQAVKMDGVVALRQGLAILSGSADEMRQLWQKTAYALGPLNMAFCLVIRACVFSPDGRYLVANFFAHGNYCWSLAGEELPVPPDAEKTLEKGLVSLNGLSVENAENGVLRLREGDRLLREICPLKDGTTLVAEPWDEGEARKEPHLCRWKLVRGPKDAWRYAVAVDLETGEVYPPECAMAPGALGD